MAKKEDMRQIAIQLSETGAALADCGQLTDALKHYNKALDCCPHLAEALFQKGIVHLKLGWQGKDQKKNFYNALKLFEETLELNPHWKHVLSYLGDARLMLGILGEKPKDNLDKAVNAYNAVLKLNPKAEPDWCGKGYALLEIGKLGQDAKKRKRIFTAAESIFVSLLRPNPDDFCAVYGRGRALLELGLLEKEPRKRRELLERAVSYGRDTVSLASNSEEIRLFFGDLFSKVIRGCDDNGGCNEAEFCLPKKTKPVGIPNFLIQRLMERKEMQELHKPIY